MNKEEKIKQLQEEIKQLKTKLNLRPSQDYVNELEKENKELQELLSKFERTK